MNKEIESLVVFAFAVLVVLLFLILISSFILSLIFTYNYMSLHGWTMEALHTFNI